MMPHDKRQVLLLTPLAHKHLHEMFVLTKSRATLHRNASDHIYDGSAVRVVAPTPSISLEGVSHALRVLASEYEPLDWIDNRTEQQLAQCELQLTPPIRFTTHKEARLHYKIYGLPTYTALWSDTLPIDYTDREDEDGNLIQERTRQEYTYLLSNTVLYYYAWIARHYKMRPPLLNNRSSLTSQASACLEAIGIEWLLPPEGYELTLENTPNTNKMRQNIKRSTSRKLYGNPNHEPYIPGKWPVFTEDQARQLLQRLKAEGTIDALEKLSKENNNA